MIWRKHRRSSTATTMWHGRSRNALWVPCRQRPCARPQGTGAVLVGLRVSADLDCQVRCRGHGPQPYRMSLGGVRDEAAIRGHRKTYIGAMPGRIMDARRAGTRPTRSSCSTGSTRWATTSAAIRHRRCSEVLDTERRMLPLRDHYIELPFDLSGRGVPDDCERSFRPFRVRCSTVWRLSSCRPTRAEEKRLIARRHLLSKQMKKHGLSENQLIVDDGNA